MNPQALMDGLVAGSMIGLGAVGVTLTYSILRFANFAHGEFISWGAYLALVVAGALGALSGSLAAPIGPFSFGWALIIAALVAIALNGGLALAVDTLLFGRLRAQKSTVIIMVMASFGAALTLRSLLEFIFTSQPLYFSRALQIAMPLGGGMRATPDQLLSLGVAAIGSVPGAMLAGVIVGLAEAFAVQLVGAEWRAAVAFVILVLVLLFRPQGIFGKAAA
jgi:branched-chain amino acid transport system permease protein